MRLHLPRGLDDCFHAWFGFDVASLPDHPAAWREFGWSRDGERMMVVVIIPLGLVDVSQVVRVKNFVVDWFAGVEEGS